VTYEFTYELSDALIRAAARRFLLHHLGWWTPLLFVLMLLLLIPLCLTSDAATCVLYFAAIVAFAVILVIVYIVQYRRGLRVARKLATRSARCTITDEGLRLENALATSFMKWGLFAKLIRDRGVWLFVAGNQQYFALPADKLSGEVGAFIEGQITAAGGRLR
jgi:hypothetical protein